MWYVKVNLKEVHELVLYTVNVTTCRGQKLRFVVMLDILPPDQ
jgi:hypothetical protein